ncbi:hypothetical protein L873DRAFT_676275 [Choiromyces venosus 120613-1]|uniref:Uncharacterized protein n=1 Tax=Choiromyces venosus 120613-1 TaxID=1336337 RepID=A0A3N4JT20_9PEZI|nr:hypothetical protein L873DRAFT_676275 [Choiromyces venosus 120613-1]
MLSRKAKLPRVPKAKVHSRRTNERSRTPRANHHARACRAAYTVSNTHAEQHPRFPTISLYPTGDAPLIPPQPLGLCSSRYILQVTTILLSLPLPFSLWLFPTTGIETPFKPAFRGDQVLCLHNPFNPCLYKIPFRFIPSSSENLLLIFLPLSSFL